MSQADWVLISEGGGGQSRAAVAAVRALAAGGYRAAVTVSEARSLAAASRSCARRVSVPSAEKDPAGYAAALRAELTANRYLTVLAASDAALIALQAPVQHLLNKVTCAAKASAAGIAVPATETFASREELLAAKDRLPYPVVLKPDVKRYRAARVDSPAELGGAVPGPGTVMVQPYLRDRLHAVVGVVWNRHLVAAVHLQYLRVWPAPCGTVASAETTSSDPALAERLVRLLDGHNGLFHAEFAGPYLLDLNPRVHASLPVAIAAGADLVSIYCDLLRGIAVPTVRGRPGMFFRWVEGDIRSLLWARRNGQLSTLAALAALRPRPGAVHSFGSLRDPGPMLARLSYAVERLRRGPAPDGGYTALASGTGQA